MKEIKEQKGLARPETDVLLTVWFNSWKAADEAIVAIRRLAGCVSIEWKPNDKRLGEGRWTK